VLKAGNSWILAQETYSIVDEGYHHKWCISTDEIQLSSIHYMCDDGRRFAKQKLKPTKPPH